MATLRDHWGETIVVKATQKRRKTAALLGVGLDADDEQKRLTRGKNYVLVGGSEDTHAVMQETALKVNEHLDRVGKRLEDVSVTELRDICHEARDSISQ